MEDSVSLFSTRLYCLIRPQPEYIQMIILTLLTTLRLIMPKS